MGQDEEREACGRRSEQFCVGCAASRCGECREAYGELGVRWRESEVFCSRGLEERGREWLTEEGAPEGRWVLCEDCEKWPLVMRECEDDYWRKRTQQAPHSSGCALDQPSKAAEAGEFDAQVEVL